MRAFCSLSWLLAGGLAFAADTTTPAVRPPSATTTAAATADGAVPKPGASQTAGAAAGNAAPTARTGSAAGAGGVEKAGDRRAELPAIFAPKAGEPSRGAGGSGRSGASKRLRELLDRPASGRAVSPEMAAKLGEVATRAAPAAAATGAGTTTTATTTAPAEAGDAVMLDPFVVEEDQLPQMKEREMLTPAGRLAEARRRQPGLRLGTIPLLNDGVALQMLEDDFARERREEEKELRGLLKLDSAGVPADVKKQIDAGAAQRKSWVDERGSSFRSPK